MGIHDELMSELREIAREWQAKNGNDPYLSCEVRIFGRLGTLALESLYVSANAAGQHVSVAKYELPSGGRSIDHALAELANRVRTLRTYEDECADLGIEPVRAQEAA